jgi:hypothetical protein
LTFLNYMLFYNLRLRKVGVEMGTKYNCPCCGKPTIETPDFYEICPICGWEDDPGQHAHPDDSIGANETSLNEAREAYKRGKKGK